MKFTQETLKQHPSEDFTGIDEDDVPECTEPFTTEFEKYEEENSSKLRGFEASKRELERESESKESTESKIVKIS
jgi:hypothetical protein